MISIPSKEAGWRGDATKCDPWGDCLLICPVRTVQEKPGMVWTTLAHHIDLELLREANRLTRKNGAVEVAK